MPTERQRRPDCEAAGPAIAAVWASALALAGTLAGAAQSALIFLTTLLGSWADQVLSNCAAVAAGAGPACATLWAQLGAAAGRVQALVAALWQKLVEMISSLTASPPAAPSGGWLSKLKPF